jgi:glycosyltransferase involved in cell wall biosynthesis
MKIVFIITGLTIGGAEIMLMRVLERIDRKEFELYVISLTDMGELGLKIASMGIAVEALELNAKMPSLIKLIKLVRLLNKIKPDLVNTWMYHADLFGGLAAKLAKISTIVWCVRSSNFLCVTSPWQTRIVLKICAAFSRWLPDLVLYNSQKGLKFHQTIGYKERNSGVMPNGIDLRVFQPNEQARLAVRQELGLEPTTILIGLIGRFDPLKNHEGFIQAAKKLHKFMPDVHFLLVGKDIEWSNKYLNDLITECNLGNNFHLIGARSDIQRVTAALDISTIASWSEAFPNVLIEAMASGVPCVSTDVGDASIIIANDEWIVPVGDMEYLADSWARNLRLTTEVRSALVMKGRERVLESFEIGEVVRRYEKIFQHAKNDKNFSKWPL